MVEKDASSVGHYFIVLSQNMHEGWVDKNKKCTKIIATEMHLIVKTIPCVPTPPYKHTPFKCHEMIVNSFTAECNLMYFISSNVPEGLLIGLMFAKF